jgi:hypothetical protein
MVVGFVPKIMIVTLIPKIPVGVFFSAEGPQDKDNIGKVILRTLSLSLSKVLEKKVLSGSNDDDYRSCHRRTTDSA